MRLQDFYTFLHKKCQPNYITIYPALSSDFPKLRKYTFLFYKNFISFKNMKKIQLVF